MCRDHLFVNTLDCGQYYVFGTLEIIGVLCQGTVIVCLYCQLTRSDLTLIDSLTEFRSSHSHHPLIVVGNFNVQEQEWLGSPYTSSAGSALRGFGRSLLRFCQCSYQWKLEAWAMACLPHSCFICLKSSSYSFSTS